MRRALVGICISIAMLGLVVPARAITFGEPDAGRHPYVGALVAEVGDPAEVWAFCTGTLISPTVVLTAAHCIEGARADGIDTFYVTFDSPVDSNATLLRGTPHTHPDAWSGGMNDPHDLAVIVLDEEVTGITPAVLPSEGFLDHQAHRDDPFTAVGYGSTRDTQQGGWQPIDFDNVERNLATQSFLSLQRAWLLLSMNPATGNGGTCYGDSGGPHFLGDESSNLIVSITVIGDSWCKATDKTYRLDTKPAREFLDDFVDLP